MTIRYRRFGVDEVEEVGKVFARGYNYLLTRVGADPYVNVDDEEAWAGAWERDRKSIFEHLTTSDGESWLAEQNGQILGYARSVQRDGVCQLTEFFVLPAQQLSGIGKELLDRAFGSGGTDGRTVISSTHAAAMARYLKAGVHPQSPVYEFERKPEPVTVETDLTIEPITNDPSTLEALNRIDRAILGFRRDADHLWMLTDRSGYLYRRQDEPVGYGYIGRWCGPFALIDPEDFPAVLAHAETEAAAIGDEFMLIVPLVNQIAVDYLLSRGFHMDDKFIMIFMADTPRPRLDRYLIASPGFFM